MLSMLSMRMRIRLPLRFIQPLIVVLLVFGERGFGQDQTGRYDILKGHDGQSSCQLRDSAHAACSTSSPPALDVTPTPTVCTCNNVFFNLWSACSFASGNNTLPLFSSWLATCTNSSIDLGKSDAMKLGGNLGIDVPQWAGIGVPGNTSFDLERAVVLQQSPNTWSILQISLPIVTALSGVMFTLLFVKMAQRRPNMRVHMPEGILPESVSGRLSRMIHPGRRVRRVNQSALEGWVIDGPPNLSGDNTRRGRGGSRSGERERRYSAVHGEGRQNPQSRTQTPVPANANPNANGGNQNNIVRPLSPPDTPNRESTIPGHPSVYSETPRQSVVGRNSSTYTTPNQQGNELQNYPFGPQAQARNQLQQRPPMPALPPQHLHGRPTGTGAGALGYHDPYNPHSQAHSFTGTGTGASTPHTTRSSIRDYRWPNPFKRKPVAIVPVEPSKGFRIDGSSEGSVSARESTAVSSDAGVRTTGVSGFDAIEEEGHGHDHDRDRDVDQDSEYFDVHEGDGNEYGYDDEGTNLMTEDERRDSALDREDRLTSFTGGTRSTHGTSIDSRVRIVSPTASTISPRSTMGPAPPTVATGNGSLRPIALPPVPQVPAPLPPPRSARTSVRTAGVASSSRTMMMSPIFEHQPSAGASQLGRNGFSSIHPSTSNSSVSMSALGSRQTPTRSASGDSTNSSENPRPLPSPGAAATGGLHQRSVSNESLRGRGPLPEPPSSGAPLNAFTNRTMTTSPPPIAHPRGPVFGHQQSHSGSGSSSHSGQRQTFMGEELYDAYMPTRRELMMELDDHDADEASFYMPEPVERSGTPSSTSRTDPAVYFPGAVRGAGYGGV